MDKALERATDDDPLADAGASASAALPSHTQTHCLNCGARLRGRFCHDCGQGADDHHRSIGHLAWEAVEGFTHLDGRLGHTLPALLFNPGRLARDHIEGRRQRHVPPFRLFLITLLLFMLVAEAVVKRSGHEHVTSASARTTARQTLHPGDRTVVVTRDMTELKTALDQSPPHSAPEAWLRDHFGRALQNREYFLSLVFEWAHRLAVLLLPIFAGLLTLAYVYRRQFYVYDHLMVAMQYLSFCFLVWGVEWALPRPLGGWAFLPVLAWTPVNLYLILRSAYRSSRLGAAVKALALWSATVGAFAALLAGLIGYALAVV